MLGAGAAAGRNAGLIPIANHSFSRLLSLHMQSRMLSLHICNGMQASDVPIVVKAFRTHDLAMLKQNILSGVNWPPPATHNPIANILPTQVSTSYLLCMLPMRSGTMAP